MLLLIDAYNLLHQSDQMQRGRAEGWLTRARERLIDSLAQHLGPELSRQTCLVFDSRLAPRGLPAMLVRQSIEVRFAVDHDEADDLLEELISRHPTPKRLMVVSSDHRIQKAASRRGAKCIDSDQWYAELVERGPRLAISWPPTKVSPASDPEKPAAPTDPAELEAWLKAFGLDEAKVSDEETGAPQKFQKERHDSQRPGDQREGDQDSGDQGAGDGGESKSRRRVKRNQSGGREAGDGSEKPDPDKCSDPGLANPFPEGYGEDLLE